MTAHWDTDVAIIGGGPGGLVSALYLRRFRRSVILVNQGKPRAAWIPKTHNLIGYYKGISGRQLLTRLQIQIRQLKTDFIHGSARIQKVRNGFCITIANKSFSTRKVIIATGIRDVQPAIPALKLLRERGLLRYCPICDGFDYRNQPVFVLAQNEKGLEESIFISFFTRNLSLIVPPFFEIKSHYLRLLQKHHIRIIQGALKEIEVCSTRKGTWVHVEGLRPFFARIGYVALGSSVPNEAFSQLKLRTSKEGFLMTTTEQRTNLEGTFAVGDCVNLLGQISVAAGQAAVAATSIHNELLEETW